MGQADGAEGALAESSCDAVLEKGIAGGEWHAVGLRDRLDCSWPGALTGPARLVSATACDGQSIPGFHEMGNA